MEAGMRAAVAARFAGLLRAAGRELAAAGDRIHAPLEPAPSEQELAFRDWLSVKGDKTLRLDYPLDARAIVFDVGGFEGQWASDIFARYLCRIHVFEPVREFADAIARRFAANDRIKVHPVALGAETGLAELTIAADGSSLYLPGARRMTIDIVTPELVFAKEKLDEISLMKINIEGAEYDLLDHMISTGLIRRIENIQVQFHSHLPEAQRRVRDIHARLAETHQPTFQYRFVWENWRRMPTAPRSQGAAQPV
jgi:FkbM family methyltransferase